MSLQKFSQYEKKFLAFIDILGWSEEVVKSEQDGNIRNKLSELIFAFQFEQLAGNHAGTTLDTGEVVTFFSDTIVISVLPKWDALGQLVQQISRLCQRIVGLGFYVRGAITLGSIIHKNNIIYGPALNRAYTLESQYSIYPRIILDKEMLIPGNAAQTLNDFLMYSPDGFNFINYVEKYGLSDKELEEYVKPIIKDVADRIQTTKNNSNINAKYVWFAEYLNKICDKRNLSLGIDVWENTDKPCFKQIKIPMGRPVNEAALGMEYSRRNRNAPCHCGSGKRFKQCHGRLSK